MKQSKQRKNIYCLLLLGLSLAASARAAEMEKIDVPIAPGPCEPTWNSLGDQFKQPKWWREAKIGMWLHWGPQSVGEDGDWYAKWIYMPRECWGSYSRVYPAHLERFGHPSESGYKDKLPLWKAQDWNPEKLMALYKRAGARYVIGQGMHHDNFDLWNSKFQPWNAVNMGPQRDILGGWEKAARAGNPVWHRLPWRLFALVVSTCVPPRHRWAEERRALRCRSKLRR